MLGRLDLNFSGRKTGLKLLTACPKSSSSRVSIWWNSKLRDQPCSTAAGAHQRRVSGSLSFYISAMWWYHGNCESGAFTIAARSYD